MSHNTDDSLVRAQMKTHYESIDQVPTPFRITFELTPEQTKAAISFEYNHNCPITYGGAVGGSCTYQFTNCNLGQICKIVCACGAETDVTDYDDW